MINPKDPKIASRESWLKVFVVGGFSAIIGWKLLSAPIAFNLSDFKFTDLLNLLLAFFAIALSVAFYFKATDTSNQFYDNTYKFTKEFSEILGRIEAGFGERLKHLDEGYSGLRERFETLPFDSIRAEKEIEKEKQELQKKEKEKSDLLEQLAMRAQLQEGEKNALFHKLKEKDDALLTAKRELNFLTERLRLAQAEDEPRDAGIPDRVRIYFKTRVVDKLGKDVATGAPVEYLRKQFALIKDSFNPRFIEESKAHGLLDDNSQLTPKGVDFLRSLVAASPSREV